MSVLLSVGCATLCRGYEYHTVQRENDDDELANSRRCPSYARFKPNSRRMLSGHKQYARTSFEYEYKDRYEIRVRSTRTRTRKRLQQV
eukprot:scaffold44106_cov39-Prasinocladus_malaysianus.AAC.1